MTPDPGAGPAGVRVEEPESTDFDAVVRRYGASIARHVWAYVDNAADHDDLLQEILIALWRSLPRFRGDSSLWTYAFRVAHNRALSYSSRGRRRRTEPIPEDLPDRRPGPHDDADLRFRRELLMAAIRRLPQPLRQAVVLHLEGATPAEIAAVQGISENNASVRVTRARAALRGLLAGDPR